MRTSFRLAGFASLLAAAWLIAGTQARAQSPDEEPDADVEQAADQAEDADDDPADDQADDANDDAKDDASGAGAAAADEQEDAASQAPDDEPAEAVDEEASHAAVDDADDAADDADDADDDYDDGSTAADDYMADDWAPDVPSNPEDDAVPEDTTLDPAGYGWVVVQAPAPASQPGRPGRTQRRTGDFAGPSEILDMRPATKPAPRRTSRHDDDKDTAYSFGGKPIRPGSAPWQAQIYRSLAPPRPDVPRWKAQHNCGGTLIAPGWVLTAAHCIDDILDDREAGWRVRLGGEDLAKEDGVTYAVDRWVRHSGYRNVPQPAPPKAPIPPPNMYSNDIGLVHIVADAQTKPLADPKRVHPIVLFRSAVKGGDEVTAIGWGMTQNAAKSFSAVPLKVDLRVMDTPLCQSRPGYGPDRVNGAVICAAREGQKTCRGDSGGPVILTNGTTAQLVGLVSWGKADCSGDGRPSVFTRVEKFLPWIDQAMKLPVTRASLP